MSSSRQSIHRLAWVSALSLVAGLLAATSAAAVDLEPGDIIVADPGAPGGNDGQLLVVSPSGGSPVAIIDINEGLVDPVDVAFEAAGSLVVADRSGVIFRIDLIMEVALPLNNTLATPEAIAVDSSGRILVLDSGAATTGAVLRFLPNGNSDATISANQAFDVPSGMALESDTSLVVTNSASGTLVRVAIGDPPTTNQTAISNLLTTPRGIAIDGVGNFLISDVGTTPPGIYAIGMGGGAPTAVSSGSTPGYLAPDGVEFEAGGTAIVVDAFPPNPGLVTRVNPAGAVGANQTAISAGVPFIAPQGVAIATVPEPTLLLAEGTALMVLGLVAARRRRA